MSTASSWMLIDTPVCIKDLQDGSVEFVPVVEQLLHDHRAAMCEPVWLELYRGVKGKREIRQLEELKRLCRWFTFDDRCWSLAANVALNCRKKVITFHWETFSFSPVPSATTHPSSNLTSTLMPCRNMDDSRRLAKRLVC